MLVWNDDRARGMKGNMVAFIQAWIQIQLETVNLDLQVGSATPSYITSDIQYQPFIPLLWQDRGLWNGQDVWQITLSKRKVKGIPAATLIWHTKMRPWFGNRRDALSPSQPPRGPPNACIAQVHQYGQLQNHVFILVALSDHLEINYDRITRCDWWMTKQRYCPPLSLTPLYGINSIHYNYLSKKFKASCLPEGMMPSSNLRIGKVIGSENVLETSQDLKHPWIDSVTIHFTFRLDQSWLQ